MMKILFSMLSASIVRTDAESRAIREHALTFAHAGLQAPVITGLQLC